MFISAPRTQLTIQLFRCLGRCVQNHVGSRRRYGDRAETEVFRHSSRGCQYGCAQKRLPVRGVRVRQPLLVPDRLPRQQRRRDGILQSDASRGRRNVLLRAQGAEKSCAGRLAADGSIFG